MSTNNHTLPFRNFFFFIGLLLALSWANPASSDPGKRADAGALTRSLVGLNTAYRQASPAARPQALQQLLDVAAERQALLAQLIEDNPGSVLRTALPARVRAGIPDEVQALLEQRLELEGELEVLYEDYPDGSHRLRHFLKAYGERISLHFKAPPPGLLSGTPAQVSGVLLDNAMAVESGQDDILTLAADGGGDGGSNGGTPAPLPNTFGEQRTLVLLVNFQNDPTNRPWTPEQTHSLVLGTVSDFMYENSYEQTWLAGEASGWYTVPVDNTTCDTPTIASEARSAASAAGVDVLAYSRYIYLFPRNAGCSWSGMGTVGGNPSESWINGKFELDTIGHELGHNFGLQHSHALECGATTLGTDCVSYEYGDHLDIMGNYVAGHLNAFQKAQLGWLGYGSSPTITTVETSGEYSLAPYELGNNGPKALKVLKNTDPATGVQTWYYLEYRQALGADAFLAGNTNILNGIVFHTGTDSDPRSSYQLDMTPASEVSGYYDWEDAALEQGQNFEDADSGSSFSTTFSDTEGASVVVAFSTPSCTRDAPTLAFAPVQSEWVAPGTLVTYQVMVANQDSLDCAASTFDMATTPPANWTAAFTQSLPALEPGASATIPLEVTSTPTATDGFYPVAITATNSADGNYAASDTVTYVVSAPVSEPPPNAPPVAVDDNGILTAKVEITMAVLANDFDPDGDGLTIHSFTQGAKGTVINNGDGTLTYTPSKRFKTADSFGYTVSDGTDTASATVSITLDAPTGGGGGKTGGGKSGGKPSK